MSVFLAEKQTRGCWRCAKWKSTKAYENDFVTIDHNIITEMVFINHTKRKQLYIGTKHVIQSTLLGVCKCVIHNSKMCMPFLGVEENLWYLQYIHGIQWYYMFMLAKLIFFVIDNTLTTYYFDTKMCHGYLSDQMINYSERSFPGHNVFIGYGKYL